MTDDGLADIRPFVVLWGTDTEVKRWYRLKGLAESKLLTDTEISELVLEENWPAILRESHLQSLDNDDANDDIEN